jgi:hypothetical protein
MIADRKLMEKGKSVIYHTGLARAPHTQAAHLALRAGFYLEKIRFLRHSGRREELERIMNYFSLSLEDLDRLPESPAVITPVNITYYPIRSRDNSLNRMAERLLKGMTEKARAELELEGSMILEGVDVDITFGDPISPEPYVRDWAEIINSGELYLEKYAWEKAFNPGKAALQLGRLYTRAIMEMTTVNLDHILATLLAVTRRRSISEKTPAEGLAGH